MEKLQQQLDIFAIQCKNLEDRKRELLKLESNPVHYQVFGNQIERKNDIKKCKDSIEEAKLTVNLSFLNLTNIKEELLK